MANSTDATENDPPIATDTESEPLTPIRSNGARPECFTSTLQEILFVLTATMAIAMSSLLTGSVTVTSSYIGRSLSMTTAEITWITAASSLSGGAFLLFFGRLADLFGRKFLFVGSLLLFSVFCLAAGYAQTPISLDILNGVLGLLSASGVPPAVGILGTVYSKPSARKNAAFACFSAGNPIGFVVGTIFGGLAADLFSWRAAYFLMAIIFVLFTLVGIWTIPRDFTPKESFHWDTYKKFDLVGVFCVIFGVGMFSAALSLGGTAGWTTSYVLALLIVGVALMVAFVLWDTYVASFPLIPMGIWRDRNFSLSLAVLVFGFMSFVPASFFLSLYFQEVWGMSPLQVAIHLLPMVIVGLATNVVAAFILHRVSNKLLMVIGASAYVVAWVLLTCQRENSSYWAFCFLSLMLAVIGADLEFNVANMYVMSSMPPEAQSIGGGIFQTVTRLSSTVGMGIATAVFNAVQKHPSLSSYWDRASQPFTAVYLQCLLTAILGVFLVPFLTLKTQGGKEKLASTEDPCTIEKP